MEAHLTGAGFNVITIEHYERPTPLVGDDGIRNWLEMFSNNMFKDLTNNETVVSCTGTEILINLSR